MNSDTKGCSTCKRGEEQYEGFYLGSKFYIQYDYRSLENGFLFSGIFLDLEAARQKRDEWLRQLGAEK